MLNEISIEIIKKCPNRCVHCSSMSTINSAEIIPLNLFKQVIDKGISLGLKTVCFSGGEPFLHPDFLKMIDYTAEKGLNSFIYTSGIVLDNSENPTSLPIQILEYIASKVTKVIFNVEASDSITYKKIMGIDGFDIMKQSISSTVGLGISTEAHFVPMKLNINQIKSTVKMCEQLGISKISFLRLVPHGRAIANYKRIALSLQETEQLKKELTKLKKDSSVNIRIGVPLIEGNHKNECEAAKGKLNIKYDGTVYPCEIFKNDKIRLFNSRMVPENIFDNKLDLIYNQSDFLIHVREQISEFQEKRSCENCIGQDYINSLKIEE